MGPVVEISAIRRASQFKELSDLKLLLIAPPLVPQAYLPHSYVHYCCHPPDLSTSDGPMYGCKSFLLCPSPAE